MYDTDLSGWLKEYTPYGFCKSIEITCTDNLNGFTDTMSRMHSDAQFAGSSSVPAHVEMMGFLGIGNVLFHLLVWTDLPELK